MMQPWPNLKDEDIAQVLNYVLTTFNAKLLPKDFSPLTSEEVKKYRDRQPRWATFARNARR